MITLKCDHCNSEIEVSDAARGKDISCAHCGAVLAPVLTADAAKTELGMPPLIPVPPMRDIEAADIVTEDQFGDNETMTPIRSANIDTFPFLAPPSQPGDLGEMAHYRVVMPLGQGGMGIVFEAVDTHLQRTVALKVMKPNLAEDKSARQRFLSEARAMASVKSDHIAAIHQVSVYKSLPYFAMEFLQGDSLEKWMERHKHASLEDIVRLGIEIARGLAAAHEKGLIHRDIKPGNIWLEGSSRRVKILDFGLARMPDRKHLTLQGLVMGTPGYMSPEQVEGKDVDSRCDLFSFGCVLYELATGKQPFTGTSSMAVLMAVATKNPLPPRALNPNLPRELAKLIMRLLEKKPQDRPASALMVLDTLEAIAAERGISTLTPSSGSNRVQIEPKPFLGVSARRMLKGPKALLGIGAGLFALMIVGFLAWSFMAARSDPNRRDPGNESIVPVQGVTESEILLGMTGPFSGPASELGRELKTGIETFFEHVNAQGGVEGRKIRLIALDDAYEPERALANVRALDIDHKVFALIGNVGTPTADKTLKYAHEKNMLFFGAFTGAKLLRRHPPDRHVFNFRAGIEEEIAAIVKYLVDIRGIRAEQIALFAENDTYGDNAYNGIVKALRRHGRAVKDIVRVGYERNTVNVEDAARTIVQHPDVRAVVMAPTYKPAAAFIHIVKDAKPEMIFTSVSFVGSEPLAEALLESGHRYADGVIVTQVVPPLDARSSLVLRYGESLKKHYPDSRPSFTSLEGYIDAALLTEGLKRAGKNLTTETLIEALESIRDLDLGLGTAISFGPSQHQASHKVWAAVLDLDGRFGNLELDD